MPATPAKKTTAAKKAATTKAAAPRAARVAATPPRARTGPANDPFGKLQEAMAPAPAGKYTLGQSGPVEPLFDLQVPSGATCQVRRPGVPGLIAAGILDGVDSLTGLVQTEHISKNDTRTTKVDAKVASKIAADPEAMAAGFALVDKLTAYVVTQPEFYVEYRFVGEDENVWSRRITGAKEAGKLPTSSIALTDKMFIMQWALGGSADLESFRTGFGATLDDLVAVQGVQL